MEPFRGVSMKCLDAYLAWFRRCRTFMVIDSRTAEPHARPSARQRYMLDLIRDMFNVLPHYMDYWVSRAV